VTAVPANILPFFIAPVFMTIDACDSISPLNFEVVPS
jgi:hypothetical protein